MQTKFLDRFSLNSEGRWQEGFKGVPVSKTIKLSQVHHPFSSAGRSMLDSPQLGKISVAKPSFKSSNSREHCSKLDLESRFDVHSKSKLRGLTSSTPVPRRINDHEKMYRECSLAEYNNMRPKQYYVLGGLGPSILGTNEWIKAKEKQIRIKNYAQILRRNKRIHL